ncbi:uncharacterized protein EKO05_0001794 [Ascochyta rabiei]|uniref:GTP binding n=1 Tax=Didymella rabiei TaxID=5454 RepID=A0A163HG36_DIDRA|nr:uncharacterized protein EKO05_0001794 [Ascochyta rabiei]KZM25278.1 GTP binding [Ascochyta rabiei]UPX11172.1 hypothetical protein EKO05_0001794 [Ascochyta rabiei]
MSEEPLTLISATPSAFARMPRIALALKKIPFTLTNEIPWHSSTQTPHHNPLEKLPILLFPDARAPVYESAHIQTYIVEKYAQRGPRLLPGDLDGDLAAKQIVALGVGCLDALVLNGWEVRRPVERQSALWIARQARKIDGAMRAFNRYVEDALALGNAEYVLGPELTIADIAIVCAVGGVDFVGLRDGWRLQYPALGAYFDRLDEESVFKETRPVMFDLSEEVV